MVMYMLLSELLLETPQLIDPIGNIGVNNDTTNSLLYRQLRKKYSKLVYSLTDDISIVRIENPSSEDYDFEYVGFDDEDKRIGMVSRVVVTRDKMLGPYVYQSFIWVSGDYKQQFRSWPNKIVFDYLIPRYTTITSDMLHTPMGMKFWVQLIQRALSKGLHAYYYNTAGHQLIKIHSTGHLSELQKQYKIWDHDDVGANKLVVISSKIYNET